MKLNITVGLLFLTQILFSQTFTELITVPEFDGVWNSSIAFSDVNGDGNEDVLITGLNSSNDNISKLYLNDGAGNFNEMQPSPSFEFIDNSTFVFSDINGDGIEDLIITGGPASFNQLTKLYINDGTGNFTEILDTPIDGIIRGSMAFSDVNGDNTEDLLITGKKNFGRIITKLYTNDGLGNFTEIMSSPFDSVFNSFVAFSDVNGDGNEDFIITGEDESGVLISKLYLHNSDSLANFAEVEDTPFEGVRFGSIAFSDVNSDGNKDVLINGENSSGNKSTKLYLNDGLGNFNEMQETPFPDVLGNSIAFSDVNGDGIEDLFIAGKNDSFDKVSKLYINDGSGNFTEKTGNPFDGISSGSIAFSDVNGDGNQDLLITGENSSFDRIAKLYTNDGSGNFTDTAITPLDGVFNGSVAFSDVNGDGFQDVLITGGKSSSAISGITRMYLNNGSGYFIEKINTPFEGTYWSSIAFADVNGDNFQDVLITGEASFSGPSTKLYTNDGLGNFTEMVDTPFDPVTLSSIAFTDVDGNGSQDVLITGQNDSFSRIAKLYTNDGLGNFTEKTGIPFDGVSSGSVAFADVNNDGTQDVLITGLNNALEKIAKLYVNNGSGNFNQWMLTSFEGVWSSSIAFADVNNDGNSDVLITGQSESNGLISKLYTNNGSGIFSEISNTPFDGVWSGSIAFADVDGNGSQDVLITGSGSVDDNSKLYTNDGLGNFSEMIDTPFDGVYDSSVAFADIDGNGAPDLLITGATNNTGEKIAKLYLNDGLVNTTEEELINNNIDFIVYPNPIKGDNLTISYESTDFAFINIKVFNLDGVLLSQQKEFVVIGPQKFIINTASLTAGSYFVQIDNGKQNSTTKFVVQ